MWETLSIEMIDDCYVIDFHVHLGEVGGIWAEVHKGVGNTAENWVSFMDKVGIDRSVVFPFPSGLLTHDDFRKANDYIISAVKRYPNRLIGFCTVTPLHGNFAVEELKRCISSGYIRGIKLYPPGHGFYPLDGPFLDPIIEVVAKNKMIVLTHTDFPTKICTPFHAVRLAERFPEVTFVIAHFGQDPDVFHWVPDIVKPYDNIILDSSNTPDIPESVYARSVKIIGADRIVFGSDAPTVSFEVNLKKLEVAEKYYGLSKEDKRKILGENALRILNIKR